MFKSLFTDWSLEKKCLFFLGLALLFSLVLGAVAVQWVAERLVRETIRQSSQDDANEAVRRKHIPLMRKLNDGQSSPIVDDLLEMFDQNKPGSQHESTLLRIKDGLEHQSLGGIFADENELKYLTKIHAKLSELKAKTAIQQLAATNNEKTPVILEPTLSPLEAVFEDAGRAEGYHVFYHPIIFGDSCKSCHSRNNQQSVPIQTAASVDPFRAIKVRIPIKDTSYWRIWSYSLLSSIGIATLALSLFFIHWILKRLVIIPLAELKFVSDEITSGKTDLEFRVETDDEFAELSDSFNRMLRHITSTQKEIQAVNQELDSRIDELASVNLQLYEANRLKGEFLANMSHELRTPLNSILGFSDVLSGIETLTDKQRRWVGNIQNSGRVLLEMINDILDLAKIEAGKTEVRPTAFDLIGLIYAQIELFRKMAEDKNINLQVDSSVQELRIEQDQGKISQILTNLISNAIKFTPEGGLVTIVAEACGDGTFFISVADTGVGIAPHEHEVIFEKFRQASGDVGKDSLTREHSGTGLGLSIVRELCRLLGGDISLTSQIGHGSTFRVVLPMTYGAKQEPAID